MHPRRSRTGPVRNPDRLRARRGASSLPARPETRPSWLSPWRSGTHARAPSQRLRTISLRAFLPFPKKLPRALEIGGRVDAERHAGDDGRVDAHAGFERPQLLKLLALLERRGRERDETR